LAEEGDRAQFEARGRQTPDDDVLDPDDVVGDLSEDDQPSAKPDTEPRPAWYNEEKVGLGGDEPNDGDGIFTDEDDGEPSPTGRRPVDVADQADDESENKPVVQGSNVDRYLASHGVM